MRRIAALVALFVCPLFAMTACADVDEAPVDTVEQAVQLPPTIPTRPPAPPLAPVSTDKWGSGDVNRCVPDVVKAVTSLRDHGEVMGYNLNGFTDDLHEIPTDPRHWQGVQRVPFGNGQNLVVARGGSPMFASVMMGSRDGDGRRFRSNRISPVQVSSESVMPSSKDSIVAEVHEDAGFDHAGSPQALGRYVAVPLENDTQPSRIAFYDLATPTAPLRIGTFDRVTSTKEAGAVALTKMNDGKYVMAVGHKDSQYISWYASSSIGTWSEAGLIWLNGPDDYEGHESGSYQTLNLVTQCDGKLFLLATHNDTLVYGRDYVHAWEVTLSSTKPVSKVTLKWAGERHLYCTHEGTGIRQCNFAASAGTYVDPTGQLLVYGTEHRADGPGTSVKMMEFRSIDPVAGCDTDPNRMWVELYDDHDFSDRGLILDYTDRTRLDLTNFHLADDMDEKTSSVRWCIPPGHRLRLYEDHGYHGSYVELTGRGERQFDAIGFGDEASSARWY